VLHATAGGIVDLPASFRLDEPVDVDALTTALDGQWGELRRGVRAQMAATVVRDNSDLTTEQFRRQVFDDLHLLPRRVPPGSASTPSTAGWVIRPRRWWPTRCSASAICR